MKKHSDRRKKSGETLVEVMVSVLIFLMLAAVLHGAVNFCTSALEKSRQIRKNDSDIVEEYVKSNKAIIKGSERNISFSSSNGTEGFSINVTLDSVEYTDSSKESPFKLYGEVSPP